MFKIKHLGIYLVVIAFAMVLPMTISSIEGQNYKNIDDLGIVISTTCLTMQKNNMTSPCPTYEEIMLFFPDTSIPQYSGNFTYQDGVLQRDMSLVEYKSPYNFYKFVDPVMFIDPPGNIRDKIKLITIHSQLPHYKISQSNTMINNTLHFGQLRHVDDRCHNANIGSENWATMLGDTVWFMTNDCDPEITSITTIASQVLEGSEFSYKDTSYYKLQVWIKESLAKCIGLCFEY